jgi:hypothetical protein
MLRLADHPSACISRRALPTSFAREIIEEPRSAELEKIHGGRTGSP